MSLKITGYDTDLKKKKTGAKQDRLPKMAPGCMSVCSDEKCSSSTLPRIQHLRGKQTGLAENAKCTECVVCTLLCAVPGCSGEEAALMYQCVSTRFSFIKMFCLVFLQLLFLFSQMNLLSCSRHHITISNVPLCCSRSAIV